MRYLSVSVLALAGLLATRAGAVDIDAIKDKLETCVACHGKDGVSEMEKTPSLAGEPDQFLQWQLVFFRSGTRKSDQMSPIAADLSNEDIRNLSGYFALALPAPRNRIRRRSGAIPGRCENCRRAPLHIVSHRHLRWHQGHSAHRPPAGGLSAQGADRLQIRRPLRWRHGCDGRRRLSPDRRADQGAGAFPGAL